MSTERSTGDVVVLSRGRVSSPTLGYDAPAPLDMPAGETDLPRRIGRYVVIEVVGMGGMGIVCTAYDPKLDRKVALKLLRERELADAKRTTLGHARLHREARALAKLKHVNVVAVHDVDVVDERLYIAMELVEGEPLSRWLELRARPWQEIVRVFVQAARGLAAAHAAGIVHRDFKPANVRLEPGPQGTHAVGRVVVLDFGLALEQGGSQSPDTDVDDEDPGDEHRRRLTAVGRRVGTPAYMAPEQILGQPVGPAADQFSFGVSLYEALYGALPFVGDMQAAMWNAIDGKVAPPPKDREVPGWLHKVVLRMLSPQPEQRYADMHAVITALGEHELRRRRRIRLGVAGVALLGAGGLALAMAAREAPCPGAHERVAAVWNPERSGAIEAAFAATGMPFAEKAWERTRTVVDERTASWGASHVAICEATAVRGEQSAELLDRRMECLDQHLRELAALLDVLGNADAALIENATGAALRLGDPGACIELRPGSADAPPLADELLQVSAVRDGLARVEAELEARRGQIALAQAEQVWSEAAALEHAPTRLSARLALGRARGLTGDGAGAENDLRAVVEDAAAGGQSTLEAEAWSYLLQVLGVTLRRPDDALALRFPAEVAVQRAGAPPQLQAHLHHVIATALWTGGDHAAAAEQMRRAVEVRLASFGEDDPDLAPARSDLGLMLVRLGQHDEAQQQFRAALDSILQLYGPEHPLVAAVSLNLGNSLAEGKHDLAGAEQLYRRAVSIREAAFGREHDKVAEVLVAQAALARRRGAYDDAVSMLERARAIFERGRKDDPRLAQTLNNLGGTLMARAQLGDAEQVFGAAIELLRTAKGDRKASLARSLGRRCEVRRELGRLDAAEQDCADATAIVQELFTAPHRELIEAQLATASLRLAQGRASEALELARSAVTAGVTLARAPEDQLAAKLVLAEALHAVDRRSPELVPLRSELSAAIESVQDRPLVARIEAWLAAHR